MKTMPYESGEGLMRNHPRTKASFNFKPTRPPAGKDLNQVCSMTMTTGQELR